MKNKRKFGKASTIILAALMSVSMLGQNLMMVYADGESTTTEPLQAEDSQQDSSKATDLNKAEKVDVDDNNVNEEKTESAEVNKGLDVTTAEKTVKDEVTSNTKQVEPVKYPAWNKDYKLSDGVTIRVNVPEGALPEGTKLEVKTVKAADVLDRINKVAGHKLSAKNITAYDFNFYNDKESNIEPKKDINIKFENLPLNKMKDIKAYHVTDDKAENVDVVNLANQSKTVVIKAGEFSIYAITSNPSVETDGKVWIGDDTATTYETIDKAVEAASEGATIHISGNFGENGKPAPGATISKNITLDVVADTTMTGDGSSNGITLKAGSHLRTSNGATLTMTKFKTALVVDQGAEVNDGNYVLKDNVDGTRGLHIMGAIVGSTDRNSVMLRSEDENNSDFYESSTLFKNATLYIKSKNQTWMDTRTLVTDNVNLTLDSFGQGYYIGGGTSIKNSLIRFVNGKKYFWDASTGAAFAGGDSEIVSSTLIMEYGLIAGLSVGLSAKDKVLTIKDSVIQLNNGGLGGLNLNTGTINFDNSKIVSTKSKSGAVYGAQKDGLMKIYNSSDIQTQAKRDSDNGVGPGTNQVVTGGTFMIKYAPNYYSGEGSTIPVNGEENGNERLDYVTLADSGVNTIRILNKLGGYYDYNVAKASPDGDKHVWVPTVKVTFQKGSETAKFADDTTDDKVVKAIRGNKITMIKDMVMPLNPKNSDESATFKGWFYKENGKEKEFTADTEVNSDLTVYAKWEKVDTTTMNLTLPGDLLLGKDSQHNSIPKVKGNQLLTITGQLVIDSIKTQIRSMARNYDNILSQIQLEGVKSTFTATLTLPNGLSFEQNTKVNFTDNDVFEIKPENVNVNGQAMTVVMSLKKNYTKFDELLEDITSIPVDNFDITVDNIKVSPTVTDASKLTIEGQVKGIFTGIASFNGIKHGFEFIWNAVQTEEGRDSTQVGGENIQLTVQASNPTTISRDFDIDGDILIGNDTEHESTKLVHMEDKLDYTGRLFIKPIREQINAFARSYKGSDIDGITLEGTKSKFVATIKFPDKLNVPENPEATLTDNKVFEITKTEKVGHSVKVTMELKNDYSKFVDLQKAINDLVDEHKYLDVIVKGITIDKSANDDEELTATGTVEGTFNSKATSPSGKIQFYNFKWTAKQYLADPKISGLENGKDAIQNPDDNNTIAYTVVVNNPKPIGFNVKIDGDILVGDNTEHDKVFDVKKNEKIDYTGRLFVYPIIEQINKYAEMYGKGPHSCKLEDIALSKTRSTFTAVITFPDKLIVPDNPTSTLTKNNVFKVTKTEKINNNSVKVTMELKKGYEKFVDLQKDVNELGSKIFLDVTVPGITVSSDAKYGEYLTATGTVHGEFDSDAECTKSGRREIYHFEWDAKQYLGGVEKDGVEYKNGKDAHQNTADDETIAFTVYVAKGDIPIEKVWNDNNDRDGLRPGSLWVTLMNGNEKVKSIKVEPNEKNQWKGTFVNIPVYKDGKPIEYTVKESAVEGYTSEVTGNVENGFKITNTHIPFTRDINVNKVWNDDNNRDGLRPGSIKVTLMNGDKKVKDLNVKPDEKGNWNGTFKDIPSYENGKEIYYTVKESVEGYDTEVTGDMNKGFVITNTHIPFTKDIKVSKVWKDADNQDGLRPESIKVTLMNGDKKVKDLNVKPDEDGNWNGTFKDVPSYEKGKEIYYTVKESVEGYDTEITGDMNKGFVITNTHKPFVRDITFEKVWNDADNQDGLRPETIKVTLMNGDTEVDSVVVKADENGKITGTFKDVPSYEKGKEIYYTVKEDTVKGYETAVTGNMKDGFVITNTHEPAVRDITINKVWKDADNKGGHRPASIVVKVMNGDKEIKSIVIKPNADNKWVGVFEKLAVNENGKPIKYTIKEEAVKNYKSEIAGNLEDGFTITNTLVKPAVEQPTPEQPNKPHNTPTGDDTNALLFAVLGLASATLLEAVAKRRSMKGNK